MSLSSTSARELISNLRQDQSDQSLWNATAERVRKVVVGWCFNQGCRGDIPDEVAQRTLIKIHGSLKSFDSSKGSFRTWVMKIARNCLFDVFHFNHPEKIVDADVDKMEVPMDLAYELMYCLAEDEYEACIRKVREASKFSDRTWSLFEHCRRNQVGPSEAARDLGLDVGNAASSYSVLSAKIDECVDQSLANF